MAFVSGFSGLSAAPKSKALVSRKNQTVVRTTAQLRMQKMDTKSEKVVKKSLLNVNESGAGTFGFTSLAEKFNGYAAMIGLVLGLGKEIMTGDSILTQLGMEAGSSKSYVFLFVLVSIWTLSSLGYVALKQAQVMDSMAGKESPGENW